jgi:hypothetical protein
MPQEQLIISWFKRLIFPYGLEADQGRNPSYCGSFRPAEGLDFRCLDQLVLELESS